MLPPERQHGHLRYKALLLLLLLGTLAGAWHNRLVAHGRPDPVTTWTRTALAYPAGTLNRFSRWCGRNFGWILRGSALERENRRLRAEVERLKAENASLQEAAAENVQLQQDLGFVRTLPNPPIAAWVIALRPDPNFNTIVISRGSNDGVHVHSVVVTRDGLVGQVSEVTPNTATVVLLTDRNGMVGARVQRASSRAVGLCRGNYSPLIPLIDLSGDADIRPGDKIVTAGYGVFPPGIPIGTVVSVQVDQGHTSKQALVKPAVDFNRLEEVYVLR
jgi:rod shape-determining protein MreC